VLPPRFEVSTSRIQVEKLLCQPQRSVLHTTHNTRTTNIHHRENVGSYKTWRCLLCSCRRCCCFINSSLQTMMTAALVQYSRPLAPRHSYQIFSSPGPKIIRWHTQQTCHNKNVTVPSTQMLPSYKLVV
jgi:hypothetical protein